MTMTNVKSRKIGNYFQSENVFFATWTEESSRINSMSIGTIKAMLNAMPEVNPSMRVVDFITKYAAVECFGVFYKEPNGNYICWETRPQETRKGPLETTHTHWVKVARRFAGDGSDGAPKLRNIVSAKEFCGDKFSNSFVEVCTDDGTWRIDVETHCLKKYCEAYAHSEANGE